MNWCLVVFLASIWTYTMGCSDLKQEPQTVAQRAKDAQIIVLAEAIDKYIQLSEKGNQVYTTQFRLICILKDEEQFMSNLDEASSKTDRGYIFNVTEMGYASGWCLKVDADVNKKYYGFLRVGDERNVFGLDQINSQAPIFAFNSEHTTDFEEFRHDDVCVNPLTQTSTISLDPKLSPKTTTKSNLAIVSTTEPSTAEKRELTKFSGSHYVAKPQVLVTDKPLRLLANTTTSGTSSSAHSTQWLWTFLKTFLIVYWVNYKIA